MPHEISPLREGQPAPWDGILFPVDTALRWRTQIETSQKQLELTQAAEQEKCLVRVQTILEEHERQLIQVQAAILEQKPVADQPWQPGWLGVLVGVGVGTVVGIIVGAAASQ